MSSAVTGNGSAGSAGHLTIDGYPSGTSTLTPREDDGTSTFTLSDTYCGAVPCVRLAISPTRRAYIARFLTDTVRGVAINGARLDQVDSFAAFDLAGVGWFYDTGSGRLWAKFSTGGTAAVLDALH